MVVVSNHAKPTAGFAISSSRRIFEVLIATGWMDIRLRAYYSYVRWKRMCGGQTRKMKTMSWMKAARAEIFGSVYVTVSMRCIGNTMCLCVRASMREKMNVCTSYSRILFQCWGMCRRTGMCFFIRIFLFLFFFSNNEPHVRPFTLWSIRTWHRVLYTNNRTHK